MDGIQTRLSPEMRRLTRQFVFQFVPDKELGIAIARHQIYGFEACFTFIQMLQDFQLTVQIELLVQIEP